MKLYEVSTAVEDIRRNLEEGVIDEDAARDTIDSLLPVAKEKGQNIAALVQNHEAEVRELKAAEERIATRRKRAESSIAWFKDYLRDNMLACEISEISCPEFVVRLQQNPAKVELAINADDLPEEFQNVRTSVTPDKKKLKEHLGEGGIVEGVSLTRGHRVVFK